MANEYAVDSHTNLIQKFLDSKYIWQFASFVLSADLACGFAYGIPLSGVSLEHIDASIPVGAILWFLIGYAFLTSVAWTFRTVFLALTNPLVVTIESALKQKKTPEDYKREDWERARHTVYESELRDYAYKNNNGILYQVYRRHVDDRAAIVWTLMFKFLVGLLLAVVPLVPRSSVYVLLTHRCDASDLWALVPAFVLMMWGTHAVGNLSTDVYVGETMAPIIHPPEKDEWNR